MIAMEPVPTSPVLTTRPRDARGLGVAALVFSILSYFMLPLVGAVIALVLVAISRSRRRSSGESEPLADGARIIAWINIGTALLAAAVLVLVLSVAARHKSSLFNSCESSLVGCAETTTTSVVPQRAVDPPAGGFKSYDQCLLDRRTTGTQCHDLFPHGG